MMLDNLAVDILFNKNISAELFVATTVAHGDTIYISPVLYLAFLQIRPPYTLASLQYQPTDN